MVQNKLLIKQFQKFIVFVSAKLVNRVTYLDITWLPHVANFGFYLNIFVNNRMKLFFLIIITILSIKAEQYIYN